MAWEMPKRTASNYLRRLIARTNACISKWNTNKVFDALSAGAVDYVEKPRPFAKDEATFSILLRLNKKTAVSKIQQQVEKHCSCSEKHKIRHKTKISWVLRRYRKAYSMFLKICHPTYPEY
jgi:DNA-binding response OmpR family regulator